MLEKVRSVSLIRFRGPVIAIEENHRLVRLTGLPPQGGRDHASRPPQRRGSLSLLMSIARTLRVAAVQVVSNDGEVEANLARAERYVDEAAARGAKLVLCPEFLAAGYRYDVSLWRAAERRGGPTERWLSRVAVKHRIHLGASYLEAEGDDFFNTFALAAPDGMIAGRVRKESLPAFEGWFFRGCPLPKIIDTELGRISVGICNDNHTAAFYRRVIRDSPDLLLMPHSAPCMTIGGATLRRAVGEIGPFYARAFGIPTVLANKAEARTTTPVPGVRFLRMRMAFPGMSTVTDSDGRVIEQLENREGIVIGDVLLDPARKKTPPGPTHSYWSNPPGSFATAFAAVFVALERLGKRAYEKSRSRRRAARAHFAAREGDSGGAPES